MNKPIVYSATAALLLGSYIPTGFSAPFTECPSEAFLVQDTMARLYGVDLATGHYQLLSNNMGTNGKLNAIAFNFHDQYLYAWSYEYKAPARIHNDYQIEALSITGLSDASFYVGDISLDTNTYYVYRPGSSHGLYAVSLDPDHADYLHAERIINGSALNLRIYDIAFHPTNGFAYSVDRYGTLHQIDVSDGSSVTLGNVGQSGVFGAVYFDVDANIYFSRNNDGHVFKVDLNDETLQAQLFAYGPSSSNNDGARCALAPVMPVDVATIDFGDAPASYGTLVDDNGARHNVTDGNLYLGSSVDAEFDAYPSPLSDDDENTDDENGIQFVTGIEVGSIALVQMTASASGYLNAWIDFDGNGSFDADEKILDSHYVMAGTNIAAYNVPSWADTGNTWARFRLSSTQVVSPTGGVSDGEVEDYAVDITETNVTVSHYPNASGWATIAFEDNWPLTGDYDFTDFVMNYRISEYRRNDEVIRVKLEGQVAAVGAGYHNGFAFHLPGIPRAQIDEGRMRYLINDIRQQASPLEANRDNAIFIVARDIWDYVSAGEDCKYHRTEPGCGSDVQMRFTMTIPMVSPIESDMMPAFPYDPFLFASDGYEHGYVFGLPPGRPYEIHLPGQAPTEAFREDFFNRGDDDSDPATGRYFVNENGMPWAINVGIEWQYPVEYMDVIYAYPLFPSFIANEGQVNADWYLPENAIQKNIFSN